MWQQYVCNGHWHKRPLLSLYLLDVYAANYSNETDYITLLINVIEATGNLCMLCFEYPEWTIYTGFKRNIFEDACLTLSHISFGDI
jgi:hypothetical protein